MHAQREQNIYKISANRNAKQSDEDFVRHNSTLNNCRYRVGANEFDQGVGCIVRGGDGYREDSVTVSRVSPDQCHLSYDDNEELVGNVIEIGGRDEDQKRLQVSGNRNQPL